MQGFLALHELLALLVVLYSITTGALCPGVVAALLLCVGPFLPQNFIAHNTGILIIEYNHIAVNCNVISVAHHVGCS